MKNLLSYEFRRLFRQPSFYVCLGISAALVLIRLYSSYALMQLSTSLAGTQSDLTLEIAKNSINASEQTVSALGSGNLTTLIAIFLALFICPDFSDGTIKNVFSRGYRRPAWLSSKLFVSVSAVLIYSLATLAVTYAGSLLFFGNPGRFSADDIRRILLQLLLIVAFAVMDICICLLVRKAGGAIAMSIVQPLAVPLVTALADILIFEFEETISRYWIGNALSELTYESFLIKKDLTFPLLLSAGYLAVFGIFSYLLIRKRDV